MEFVPFPKIPRLDREIIITEKIDGTNGVIAIGPSTSGMAPGALIDPFTGLCMRVGSRNRWLSAETGDNFGFFAWAYENRHELFQLGEGIHHGEWWGKGIQRGYGLDHKRFSLFNTSRWAPHDDSFLLDGQRYAPACCHVVPELDRHRSFSDFSILAALYDLDEHGSFAAPGFMKPEGVVVYHTASNQLFKKTIENDESPKSKAREAA